MRGKIAIVVMLMLALAAAGFAWYQNYHRSARARAFWGEQAVTIRFARQVEAFRVADLGQRTDVKDISGAPGLLNARTALMSDDGFDWSVNPVTPKPSSEWNYGVRFVHDDNTMTLLFSDQSDAMLVSERGHAVQLDSKTAAGWRSYLKKVLQADRNQPVAEPRAEIGRPGLDVLRLLCQIGGHALPATLSARRAAYATILAITASS